MVIFRQFSSKITVILDKKFTGMTTVISSKIVENNRTPLSLYRRGFDSLSTKICEKNPEFFHIFHLLNHVKEYHSSGQPKSWPTRL